MLGTDIAVLKWGGGIVGGVVAFFTLKKVITTDIESNLKLRLDLVHAEIDLIKASLVKIEEIKLSEKEHELMCGTMQLQIQSLEDCIKREFEILHRRMDKRRVNNGSKTA